MKRIGIVDSGWACTTQDSLRGVFPEAELISGIYLGVSNQGYPPDDQHRKYGLLRDDFRRRRQHNAIEASAGVVRLWDTLLREPAGTVLELRRNKNGVVEPVLKDQKVIGDIEIRAAESIRQGVRDGTLRRMKGATLLIRLSQHFSDADLEEAATEIARRITTRPNRKTARSIMRLGFDEGTAGGRGGFLGIGGIRDGVAWYPGLLASAGLGWSSPLLGVAAKMMYRRKCNRSRVQGSEVKKSDI